MRHPNANKGLASFTRRARNFATIGAARFPDAPTPRRTGYELRNAAGAVLASCDSLEPLLRNLGEKRDCVVVRARTGEVVERSPVTERESA